MSIDPEEAAWERGHRAAWRSILGTAIGQLGHTDDMTLEAMVAERADAIAALRSLCAEFGDTEWDDNLHLYDIIDKHLGRHLRERQA